LTPVSQYCERTVAGLWGEPVNAVSNVVFLLASAVLLWLVARRPRPPVSVWLLPALLGIVGLCSLSFHTFATPFTEVLDSVSILVFVLCGLTVLLRWMWGVPWRWAWLSMPAFVVFAVAVDAPLFAIGGQRAALGGYLPALLCLVGVGLALRLRAHLARYGGWLLWAAAVFAVSLAARTADRPLCARFPTGTHFIWHCLNALVLFIVGYAVLRRYQSLIGAGRLVVRPVPPGDPAVVRILVGSWGGTVVVGHGEAMDAATMPGLLAERDGEPAGALTYRLAEDGLEVVTIDAVVRHSGAGSAVLAAAVETARAAGAPRLWLVTTNDNLDALRFYQRRGLCIVAVAPDALDATRVIKPHVPLIGAYGIPLRDELTLELIL
jgi:hypothetical protein